MAASPDALRNDCSAGYTALPDRAPRHATSNASIAVVGLVSCLGSTAWLSSPAPSLPRALEQRASSPLPIFLSDGSAPKMNEIIKDSKPGAAIPEVPSASDLSASVVAAADGTKCNLGGKPWLDCWIRESYIASHSGTAPAFVNYQQISSFGAENTSPYKVAGMGDKDVYKLADGTRIVYTFNRNAGGAHLNQFNVTAPNGRVSILNTPLVLDLKGRGIRTAAGSLTYDIAGTGMGEQIAALPADIGVLAFDADSTGVPGQDGRGLFGNNTDLDGKGRPGGYTDGFEALAAFVARAERAGKIPAGTAAAGRLDSTALAALERAYGLRLLLGGVRGRAVTLREAGVSALLLSTASSRRARNFDGRGDALSTRARAVFERIGGGSGRYADIWFVTQHPLPQRLPLLRTFLPAPVAK